MEYLAIPYELREDYLTRSGSMRDSIAFSIGLLLSTRRGSMPFLPEFGCDIWDLEYGDLETADKAAVRATLRNAIADYERRLTEVSVSFTNVTTVKPHAIGIDVRVVGLYREDGEEKKFEGTFFIG